MMAICDWRGTRIAYDDEGAGDYALLCLPGWCVPRSIFDPFIAAVAGRVRVLALDWPGHGESQAAAVDFGSDDLAEAAIAVMRASGVRRIMPVAQAHAGWVALELRRRLGAEVAGLVCLSWLVLEPPPPFLAILDLLGRDDRWREGSAALRSVWLDGAPEAVSRALAPEMDRHDYAMWSRAAREIKASFARYGSPLAAASALAPPSPVLHLFAQPKAPAYLEAQEAFATRHTWFTPHRLSGVTHFPTLETPVAVAEATLAFIGAEAGAR